MCNWNYHLCDHFMCFCAGFMCFCDRFMCLFAGFMCLCAGLYRFDHFMCFCAGFMCFCDRFVCLFAGFMCLCAGFTSLWSFYVSLCWLYTRMSQIGTLSMFYLLIYWTQKVHNDFIFLYSILLPPVGHSSNHEYRCWNLQDHRAVVRNFIALLRFSYGSPS